MFPVLVNCDAVSDDDSCEEFTSESDAVKGDCEFNMNFDSVNFD